MGQPPLIDGVKPDNMRVGCGSATLGLFSPLLKEAADEAIILDSHLTGLMSEHAAGRFVGAKPSGIRLKFRKSTPGRYFGDHGKGWGGTSIVSPLDVIAGIDHKVARPGMRILVTETTGQERGHVRASERMEAQRDFPEPMLPERLSRPSLRAASRRSFLRFTWEVQAAVPGPAWFSTRSD